MGSRLGRRVVNFANLPIKLLMPTSFSNITEIALKTIPSASKVRTSISTIKFFYVCYIFLMIVHVRIFADRDKKGFGIVVRI